MRVIFSFLGLLVVVAIIGFLAKTQLSQSTRTVNLPQVPGAAASGAVGISPTATATTPQNVPKQVEANVNALLEQAAKRTEAEAK